MPPILLCWSTTSEADVDGMAVEVEPSRQYSVKFCCRATDDSRGAVRQNGVWHWSTFEAEVCNWIPPCGEKKLYPMTFIDACWTFTETKQWMLAQWGGGWCVSAVATVKWKTSHLPDGHAQLSHREMKNVSISSPAWIDGLRLGNCVGSWISASIRWKRWWQPWNIVVSMEINKRHYFRRGPLMRIWTWTLCSMLVECSEQEVRLLYVLRRSTSCDGR